jgi:hypothetical protein
MAKKSLVTGVVCGVGVCGFAPGFRGVFGLLAKRAIYIDDLKDFLEL